MTPAAGKTVRYGALAPTSTCNARLSKGKPGTCKQAAGWGTDHPGQGRCKLHGGAKPIVHGRYSVIERPEIRDLVEGFAADPNPLDTLPELALARAHLVEFVNRHAAFSAALLAWHESYRNSVGPIPERRVAGLRAVLAEFEVLATEQAGELSDRQAEALRDARAAVDALEFGPDGGKPTQVVDIADAVRHADTISKMVERIEKARASNAITRDQLGQFLFALKRILDARITDEGVRAQITADLLSVHV